MKSILLSILLSFTFACHNKADVIRKKKHVENFSNDSTLFKLWLNDTLNHLKSIKSTNSNYIFSKDSTYLEIRNKYSYNMPADSVKNNKDLQIAYYLLKQNNSLPNNQFKIELDITHYYDIAKNDKKYEYHFEINKLTISTPKKVEYYSFLKGNLINKRVKSK
jgi:hypothetical protein